MVTIHTVFDSMRGCGERKKGGLYLVTDGPASGCGLFPIPLHTCPTCSAGIKPARGWTWVDVAGLLKDVPDNCATDDTGHLGECAHCPLAIPQRLLQGRAGLLWIGEVFYKTPADWLREAVALGISRRVKSLPNGFALGKTWVLAAHRKAIVGSDAATPGIIAYFCPQRIEYVVKGDETEEELERLEERVITLVDVKMKQTELL